MKTVTLTLLMIFGIVNSQELKIDKFQNWSQKSDKPILIYMKTSWCSVCKIQMHQVENDPELRTLLNENVHFIIFDAEKTEEKIELLGKTYDYIPNGTSGIHELAIELSSKRKPVYPTWIVMDANGKILFYHEGLIDLETLKSSIKKPSENESGRFSTVLK